jgi:hypothetical protein
MRPFLIPIVLLLLLLVTGRSVVAQGPELTVSSPTDGATVEGGGVTLTFRVAGMTLLPSSVPLAEAGQHPEVNRSGQGHVHLMLDLQPVMVVTTQSPYTFNGVQPGEHLLMVELVNNDHSSLSPPVVRQVRFRTVQLAVLPTMGTEPEPDLDVLRLPVVAGGLLLTVAGILLRRRRA